MIVFAAVVITVAILAGCLVTVNVEEYVFFLCGIRTAWADDGLQIEGDVDVFAISYDKYGETTVKSSGIDKVIAPGTSKSTTFYIKNSHNTNLKYNFDCWLELNDSSGKFALSDLPLSFRLQRDGRYLIGSDDGWIPAQSMKVSDLEYLTAGRRSVYVIEWQWPFERGKDEEDTLLGNTAVDADIAVTLHILVRGEDDTGSSDERHKDDPEKHDSGGSKGGGGSGSGNSGGGGDSSNPVDDEEFRNENVELAEKENVSTGDSRNIFLYAAAGFVLTILIIAAAYKKTEKADKAD